MENYSVRIYHDNNFLYASVAECCVFWPANGCSACSLSSLVWLVSYYLAFALSYTRILAENSKNLDVYNYLDNLPKVQKKIRFFFFIGLPPEFFHVSGPLTQWCASTVGTALLYSSRVDSFVKTSFSFTNGKKERKKKGKRKFFFGAVFFFPVFEGK